MDPATTTVLAPPQTPVDVPATPAQVATELVNQQPGRTVGELLCSTGLTDASPQARHHARTALVPALHAAEANRTLIRGPMRQCHQGGGVVSTWLPASAASPRTHPSGLVALEDLVHEAAVRLQAQE